MKACVYKSDGARVELEGSVAEVVACIHAVLQTQPAIQWTLTSPLAAPAAGPRLPAPWVYPDSPVPYYEPVWTPPNLNPPNGDTVIVNGNDFDKRSYTIRAQGVGHGG